MRWAFVLVTMNNTDNEQHLLSVRERRKTQHGQLWKEQSSTVLSLEQLKVSLSWTRRHMYQRSECFSPASFFSACLVLFHLEDREEIRVQVYSHNLKGRRVTEQCPEWRFVMEKSQFISISASDLLLNPLLKSYFSLCKSSGQCVAGHS